MSGLTGDVHMNWFYDVDRGGIWRQQVVPAERVTLEEGVKAVSEEVHVTLSSRGLVLGTYGKDRRGRVSGWAKSNLRIFDVYANTLRYVKAGGNIPGNAMEGTAHDMMRDRGKIFYLAAGFSEKDPKKGGYRPCAYDLKTNTWEGLESKDPPPPARVLVVRCLDGQDAVWACLARKWGRERTNWLYSLKTGRWKKLPGKAPGVLYPYGQVVYVSRFGVLFNLATNQLMRPDVSKMEW
jgi:hypothetical protein